MLAGCPAIHAHEIGTTRVSVVLHEDRRYDVEIATDAAALVEKLAAVTGRTPHADAGPAALQSLLTDFDEAFRQRVKVRFDASDDHPAIAYAVAAAVDGSSAAVATIRLAGSGSCRRAPLHVELRLDVRVLRVDSSSRFVGVSGDRMAGRRSDEYAVRRAVGGACPNRLGVAWRYLRLGFTHIVPGGLDHVLFVLGIYLLSGRALARSSRRSPRSPSRIR